MDVAIDGAGNVFIIDSGYSRAQRFASDGALLEKSGMGKFMAALGVAIDSNGYAYIIDSYTLGTEVRGVSDHHPWWFRHSARPEWRWKI
ncbi:MAG: hypothetical protein ABFC89_13435 [Methanospirillum sp.]